MGKSVDGKLNLKRSCCSDNVLHMRYDRVPHRTLFFTNWQGWTHRRVGQPITWFSRLKKLTHDLSRIRRTQLADCKVKDQWVLSTARCERMCYAACTLLSRIATSSPIWRLLSFAPGSNPAPKSVEPFTLEFNISPLNWLNRFFKKIVHN